MLNAANHGLAVIILSLLLVTAVGVAVLHLKGASLLSVQTASMMPTFGPGDALVVSTVPAKNLRLGEVISYRNPRDPNVTITHRLIAIDPQSGWLTTAGDARHSTDPSFPPNLLIGHAKALFPGLGKLLDELHRPAGLAVSVYLPALTVIGVEVRNLASLYTRPIYSARL